MPRARIYKTNADRQRAYRERKAKAERASVPNQSLVRRVMKADAKAQA